MYDRTPENKTTIIPLGAISSRSEVMHYQLDDVRSRQIPDPKNQLTSLYVLTLKSEMKRLSQFMVCELDFLGYDHRYVYGYDKRLQIRAKNWFLE